MKYKLLDLNSNNTWWICTWGYCSGKITIGEFDITSYPKSFPIHILIRLSPSTNFIHRKKVCVFHTFFDPAKLETKIQTLSPNTSSQMNQDFEFVGEILLWFPHLKEIARSLSLTKISSNPVQFWKTILKSRLLNGLYTITSD